MNVRVEKVLKKKICILQKHQIHKGLTNFFILQKHQIHKGKPMFLSCFCPCTRVCRAPQHKIINDGLVVNIARD